MNLSDSGGVAQRRTTPRLGVVLMDTPHYRAATGEVFPPCVDTGIGTLPEGFFESPASWAVPTVYAVASHIQPEQTLAGDPAVTTALVESVSQLAPACDLVTTDCGFFWAARDRAQDQLPGATLLSGIDLLQLASVMTNRDIGLLTHSEVDARRLLARHPLLERLCIVGMSAQSNWKALEDPAWGTSGNWTVDGLRAEFCAVVESALRTGVLRHVGVLVLECTVLPQFRPDLRALTTLPILDVAAAVSMALG